jgi:parvulin-like peptidyl-prolyl isomerase
VTDAQVAAAYDKNQPFTQPEERAISIIVVATQATGEDVLNQLNSGANFATLAAQDSLDSSKSAGGADGTYSQQDLQQSNQTALASTVFGATLNAPFGPVQATGGEWVVGEVTAITPAATYGNDAETQAAIKNYLVDQQLRQQWIAYLAKQLKGADITYAPAYRPAHPGQPPQPTLPSISQFVINAHQSTTSGSSGTSGTSGTSPSSP